MNDLAYGQVVIVAFRWIMVTAGFAFAIWNPAPVPQLRLQILVLLGLAVANFYLHTQLLRGRFALDAVVFATSAADIGFITVLVVSGGGFDSPLYIFYYPAILVYSVAFAPGITAVFTVATLVVYNMVCAPSILSEANLRVMVTRLLVLIAVAACGALYWKIERDRRGDRVERGDAADLFFGQVVIIIARWTLVTACVGLVLWTAGDEWQLISAIVPVVALMALNFFLHGRYLLERPANRVMTAGASLLDLGVITLIISAWPGPQGLASQFFALYYPVLMAFAFVFTPSRAAIYTGLTLVAYAGVCLVADPAIVEAGRTLELLVQRLTTLAAVGGLSTYYWRVQRARRQAVAG